MVHNFYTRHGKLSFACVMRSKVGFFQVIYTLKVNSFYLYRYEVAGAIFTDNPQLQPQCT